MFAFTLSGERSAGPEADVSRLFCPYGRGASQMRRARAGASNHDCARGATIALCVPEPS
ncbi:conserved hypothetical protein [Burkholderia vietnamiensis]|nr:conserved hypothetical protein [Burkholderia vietnamiensis]